MREIGFSAALDIKRCENCFAFFSANLDQAAPVRRPQWNIYASSARGCVVAENTIAYIEIEIRGQVPRLCVRGKIDNPQVRLGVGVDRLRCRCDKRDLFAVRTERQIIHFHIDRIELCRLSATGGDRIELRPRQLVIRLVNAQ